MASNSTLDASSLEPLPHVLWQGLIAVSLFGILSFLSSCALFVYLSVKLVKWHIRGNFEAGGCNQFIILIYNLVLADMQQAMAFTLTFAWLGGNKIDVKSRICWTEGWFVSTGDLASSMWIFAISLHTFFAVVKRRRLPTKIFVSAIGGVWLFVFAMATIGVLMHPHGFYVRAGAWCWIGEYYATERLWLHYFWIFFAMFGTVALYVTIYATLRSRLHITALGSNSSLAPLSTGGHDPQILQRAAKYMILYPGVYVLCTLPLAAGRMAAMTGITLSYWYYCLAGAAITSCGWLDVLLYACTRSVLVFSDKPPALDDCGLDTFGILNGSDLFFGMTTTIEGGLHPTHTVCGQRRGVGFLSALHTGRRTPNSSRARSSSFTAPVAGMVTTKTTISISSAPMSEEMSELSTPGTVSMNHFGEPGSGSQSRRTSLIEAVPVPLLTRHTRLRR